MKYIMLLVHVLLEMVLCFCASTVCSDTVIETNNDSKLISTCGLNVTGRNTIDFRIKACSEVSIGLMDITNPQTPKYKVLFGMENNTLAKIQPSMKSTASTDVNQSWYGLNCDSYVGLWVAWLKDDKCIKAGTGIRTDGEEELLYLNDYWFDGGIIDIKVSSTSHADWIFDFATNSTNACTSAVPGSNDTAVNTTMTTSPTANMIQTNLSATEPQCVCSCDNITNTPLTKEELIQKIEQLRSELTVDTKKTSRYKRSLISTADDRSSSKCIGTFSVVVLVIVICVIVLMDFRHYAPKISPQKK